MRGGEGHRPGTARVPRPDRWHRHQPCLRKPRRRPVRHNAATELRKEFGIEPARLILGHRSAAITEVYAEKDEQQGIDAIVRVG